MRVLPLDQFTTISNKNINNVLLVLVLILVLYWFVILLFVIGLTCIITLLTIDSNNINKPTYSRQRHDIIKKK